MNDDASSLEPSSTGRQMTASSNPKSQAAGAASPDAAWVDRLFGWLKPSTNGTDLRTDLEDALAEEQSPGHDFSPEERAMLRNILRLRETRTEDVMVPRADIVAIDQTTSLGLVLEKLRSSGHSRMPIFDGSLDHPVGMVHIKDVVSHLIDRARQEDTSPRKRAQARKAAVEKGNSAAAQTAEAAGFDLRKIDLDTSLQDAKIVRPLLFVPASMSATDLMAQMQANRVQMALVIDEYGGTDGLISLEDLIETVVGDIEDEHDDDVAPHFDAIGDGGYIADARVPIKDVQQVFGHLFEIDKEDAEEIDTLGGLVFTALGRIPVRGELIDAVDGLDIEVTDADPRRIKRLKVYPAGLRRRDPRTPRRAARPGAANEDEKPSPDAQDEPLNQATGT
ncbi:MAG: hemolysin family protein [Pseudomonadota bacterium]